MVEASTCSEGQGTSYGENGRSSNYHNPGLDLLDTHGFEILVFGSSLTRGEETQHNGELRLVLGQGLRKNCFGSPMPKPEAKN